MNHKAYINIPKSNFHMSTEKMGFTDNFIFMHDNNPKHRAHNTRLWMFYNTANYMETPPVSRHQPN